ncbi:PREDICTED: CMP-N-acetylneuraminate-beta-galactosamide-alpha-2,3-sialyltransferase 1-like [Cyprinodon variegatus]|uniref:CMP-N-acetylneuraminate-beta-galactosamide-alpha-2,3-sialyltransferase 1 n=1 Tax=Cyprinodon variegatus TaxID=28743 RepID=A0A3Q2FUF1_CYPVA|nr:PREDICTED: CMP-N-acetylneuraminate-beta-galactosamide-alpha-2,3-sialyltransferase 1-like [Cyprinodon variegatus]XP_015225650.1 PREDICTED: CMP-N-acetylneuraminate-beta-galactosamide-alpha-2,3-sialyltransferase 1-like [Cyprinodon variegatus]
MSLKLKPAIFLLSLIGVGLIVLSAFSDCNGWLQSFAPTACFSDKNANVLFVRRLNRSIKPFLSAKTKLSEDDFNWWKRIQIEHRDFAFYKNTVSKLFEIFPPVPDLGKACSERCRTCAVVGNSVNLKGSRYGRLIDYQDVIIRMNFAPTKGFEEDVGTKTTYRVMYPESASDLDNSTHLVLFPFKIQDLDWLMKAFTTGFSGRSYAPLKSKINANKDLVKVINPAFMKYSHMVWLEGKGTYPSTGFMTLILALHICDEIHVFGYGADSDGNWSHYFEALENKNLKTGPHPGQHEYEIIKQLADEKTVELHQGS